MAKKDSLTEHLKTHFGFDTFKGNQKAIIENVLAGNDTFVLICTSSTIWHSFILKPLVLALDHQNT